jgi:MoxR-like ATPase
VRGERYVTPDTVKACVMPVLAHRLIAHPHAAAKGRTSAAVLGEILAATRPPV